MIAFHGRQDVKDLYLARVRAHRAADQIVQAYGYWVRDGGGEFRGCAVGCTLHSDEHDAYETELGVPSVLAHLEDSIFEDLEPELALAWPEGFLESIPVGADLGMVWPQFAVWLLGDAEEGCIRFATGHQRRAIERVVELYGRVLQGEKVEAHEWSAATNYASTVGTYAGAATAAAAYAASAASAAASASAASAASAESSPAPRGASGTSLRGRQLDLSGPGSDG